MNVVELSSRLESYCTYSTGMYLFPTEKPGTEPLRLDGGTIWYGSIVYGEVLERILLSIYCVVTLNHGSG